MILKNCINGGDILSEIDRFLDTEGKIKQLPQKVMIKKEVLAYLALKFEFDIDYTEKEVNEIIKTWHTFNDYFLLRRELIDYRFISRTTDGSRYWKDSKYMKQNKIE